MSQERNTLQQEKASLTAARDEQAKLAAERLDQNDRLVTKLDITKAENAEINAVRDQLGKRFISLQRDADRLKEALAALEKENIEIKRFCNSEKIEDVPVFSKLKIRNNKNEWNDENLFLNEIEADLVQLLFEKFVLWTRVNGLNRIVEK